MKLVSKIIISLAVCTTYFVPGANAQDIHFSQFFETPVWRNPSLAGIFKGDTRVQGVYRDQWNSLTNAYRTGSLNAEFKLPVGKNNDFITTGVQLLFDRAGSISWTSTHLLPVINYHKSLSAERNRYLSLGFMGGLVQRSFDASKITTNSQYDNLGIGENFSSTQHSYLDGSVGLSYNSDINDNPDNNYFLGAAYHHFNKPNISFSAVDKINLAPKWVFSGGVKLGVSEFSYVTLLGDFSKQGEYKETVAGGMYGLKIGGDPENPDYTLHAGGFLRWNDAIIPAIKLDYNPFSVAVSYDVNISKLKQSSFGRGGFELSVTYIGFRKYKSSLEYSTCPRF